MEEKRQEISEQIEKEKQNVINKFDKLMKQNKGIQPYMIKELFPDDEELYNKVKEIKNKEKEMKEENYDKKNKKNYNSDSDNDSKSKSKGKINKKVEEYRNQLQIELDKLIKEEKNKEIERKKQYENASNTIEKQKIEKINQVERAAGEKKISILREEIENKVKEYENHLKNN